MTLAFWAVGIILFLYVWVWTRPSKAKPPVESSVIDRRWYVRDREGGGYVIIMEWL